MSKNSNLHYGSGYVTNSQQVSGSQITDIQDR